MIFESADQRGLWSLSGCRVMLTAGAEPSAGTTQMSELKLMSYWLQAIHFPSGLKRQSIQKSQPRTTFRDSPVSRSRSMRSPRPSR